MLFWGPFATFQGDGRKRRGAPMQGHGIATRKIKKGAGDSRLS